MNNVKSGPCLLRQMLSLMHINTWAKAFHNQNSLIEMKQHLTNTAGNITEFNNWAWSQVSQLHAIGEPPEDLCAYLKKTCLAAMDRDFIEYVKLLRNSYEDGTTTYLADQLMLQTENKYKNCVLTTEWGDPSDEQVEIVALMAQVNVIKKELATKEG